jgi:flavodoxin
MTDASPTRGSERSIVTSIDRRSVLRGAAILNAGAVSALLLTACGQDADPRPSQRAPETAPEAQPTPERSPDMALVYFSRPGENYWYGDRRDLDVGNTQVVAEQIAALIDADVIRIDAADPYRHEYDPTVDRNREEQEADARPEIAGGIPDLSGYDTIILGCPVWNTRAPMIIRTLLDATDLTGKAIHPFTTYAVGEGGIFADYAKLYPGAALADGLAIQGEDAADAGPQIEQWVADNGLASRQTLQPGTRITR